MQSLPSILFPSDFPTKILYAFLISPMYAASHLSPPRLHHSNNIWRSVQVMKLLIMQSSSASCHFLPLRSKYSPQHPVLKHPQICALPLMWQTKLHAHTEQAK
jgi:hypothetical protein